MPTPLAGFTVVLPDDRLRPALLLVTRLFLSVEYVRSVRHLRQWYIRLILLKLILLLFRQEILHQNNLHPTPRRIPLCGITK